MANEIQSIKYLVCLPSFGLKDPGLTSPSFPVYPYLMDITLLKAVLAWRYAATL
jgi:hypothetical protein